jgi:hypothetical protein
VDVMGSTHVKCMQHLSKKSESKRPHCRFKRRLKDNIKMDINKIECEGVYWIQVVRTRLQWLALVNTAMNIRVL